MNDCQHCTPCALDRLEKTLLKIVRATTRLEQDMAKASEQINELSSKVDGLTAVTTDIAADFQAFKTAMEAERENLTAEGQAALDTANAKLGDLQTRLGDLDVAVGDADGSDTVTEPTPAPATGGGADDAPPAGEGVEFTPDQPVEGDAQPTA